MQPTNFYERYHAPRYQYLINIIGEYISDPHTRILDIGRSSLTQLIHKTFDIRVDSLGFEDNGLTSTGQQYQFDLNDSQNKSIWPKDLSGYNIIIMAEVIEHLHTSPTWVLKFLKTILLDGGVLIIQTPNAVSLMHRIKMLLGYNPFELIREDENPGHFRELTLREIRYYAAKTGLIIDKYDIREYFDIRYPVIEINGIPQHTAPTCKSNARYYLTMPFKILFKNLRSGITVVIKKNEHLLN